MSRDGDLQTYSLCITRLDVSRQCRVIDFMLLSPSCTCLALFSVGSPSTQYPHLTQDLFLCLKELVMVRELSSQSLKGATIDTLMIWSAPGDFISYMKPSFR